MLSDLPKAESRMLVARGWEGRGREAGVNRDRVSVLQDENSSGDGGW